MKENETGLTSPTTFGFTNLLQGYIKKKKEERRKPLLNT